MAVLDIIGFLVVAALLYIGIQWVLENVTFKKPIKKNDATNENNTQDTTKS